MRVSELMTSDPHIINADDTVLTAAETLARRDIGALPVAKGDRLIGMITDRDIAVRVVAGGRDPKKTQVEAVVSRSPKYCYDDEDVEHVAENMHQLMVRRLPVVNRRKRLVGIISIEDIEPRDPERAAERRAARPVRRSARGTRSSGDPVSTDLSE